MSALKPGDVVKRRGPDGKPTGPAMVIADRATHIMSDVCWECVWHWNGETKRRAFVASTLLPVAALVERPSDTEASA